MIASHSRSIQLIRTLLSYVVPPLHSNELLGLLCTTRANPNDGENNGVLIVQRIAEQVGDPNVNRRWTLTLTEGLVKVGKISDHSACRRVDRVEFEKMGQM
ncbi:hypothetical protein H5410_030254 [Solanum commersonii]|uniref:Uncharacterized protein n=1 Tax=Solanum commersonii TaxID=4109 RepID=A0A9J5YI42_SOLCO|nr:hypothetical protein H5410_030254 [Solanum commersonii]